VLVLVHCSLHVRARARAVCAREDAPPMVDLVLEKAFGVSSCARGLQPLSSALSLQAVLCCNALSGSPVRPCRSGLAR
jgi:hypothetical protein